MKLRELRRILEKINALAPAMRQLSDEALRAKTDEFRLRLAQGETLDNVTVEAFAAVREAARRVLGLYPFDVQVLGALALHQGHIAEMKTGEGKTLTATLPLYLNALTGKGVLLITTNEYLARRDAKEMGPLYRFMGLSVGIGAFEEGEEVDIEDRRAVYAADVTYTTSTALGFDYLAENLAGDRKDKFMRPFHYAIVDEADAVLLDSAQTPLIISGSPRVQSNLYDVSNQFVLTLEAEEEYHFNQEEKTVYLTEKGSQYAESFFDVPDLYAESAFELNRHINLALRAHHLYQRDVDYVVMNDEVQLLDNRTGRILEGTRLQSGIHQAIETKEGVKKTKNSRSIASVTYQSLFNMFPRLAGMTGTGKLAEDELIATYQLSVVVIPTNTPIRRIDYPDQVYVTLPEKLQATLRYVKTLHEKGQPVLLISGTVDIAEIYSRMLLQEGIPHSVLTAKNTAKEALIIQEAGRKGTVTVATSLAGRGTDIKLGEGVAALGGLAVVGTERMPNSRIDWQLRGRAGRQGDPGLSQFFVSLEDELLQQYGGKSVQRYFDAHNHTNRANYGHPLKGRRYQRFIGRAQSISEDKAVAARSSTIRFDESLRVQRTKIYALRNELIEEERALEEQIDRVFHEVISDYVRQAQPLTEEALRRYILEHYSYQLQNFSGKVDVSSSSSVRAYLWQLYQGELKKKASELGDQYAHFLRLAVLRAIDECWVEQVDNLQQLKSFVTMRQIGQRDSITEYYRESLLSYEQMSQQVKRGIVRHVMLSRVEGNPTDGHSIYFV
ncbi:accessory Sec system translocase SecA2 [Streptococcus cuniculi]|uniref:Protein translocase subunit SecA n=2 Tax=Streptococcus cuniculi TaxID=1432788 RepID=A0A4Y9J9R0_9STRE|nr:accessory Sec system translocase SecA2 [Streptococcus cuniculi]TFU97642.1 accessory Sec system translocase SecA2 [Streptococcus cuniculi]